MFVSLRIENQFEERNEQGNACNGKKGSEYIEQNACQQEFPVRYQFFKYGQKPFQPFTFS
ncbi:MAG TPA: hypothetical protein DCX89_06295 [Saprospirales bacterium]|nr:hypothetical protein [Saprospirales bacterium]